MRRYFGGRCAVVAFSTVLLAAAGCSSTRYERSTGEYVDDQMLNRRVQSALNQQPVYKYPDVHVHSFRGVVQLSGFVASEAQRDAAAEIAQRVRGVGAVENAISLAPLASEDLRDFIPGRDSSDTNRTAAGRPGRSENRESGSSTNSVTTTNSINGVAR